MVSHVQSGWPDADFTPSLDHGERKRRKTCPGQILCSLTVSDLLGCYRTEPFLVNVNKDDVPVFSKLLGLLPSMGRMPDHTYLERWLASNPKPTVPPPLPPYVQMRTPLQRLLGVTEQNHLVQFKRSHYELQRSFAEGYLRIWESNYQSAQFEAENRKNPPDPPPPSIPSELHWELTSTRSAMDLLEMNCAEPLSVTYYRNNSNGKVSVNTFAKDLQKNFAYYHRHIWRSSKYLSSDEWKLLIERKEQRFNSMMQSLEHRASGNVQRIAIPDEVRLQVWRRDEGKCVKCESRQNLEFDHIVPVAMGGSNTARNVELLCQTCNRVKGCSIT